MALNRQPVNINFSQGINTKQDPFQLPIGTFANLQNSVFDIGGMLQKRNGYAPLTSIPNSDATFLTTFNGNLTAVGSTLQAYSQSTETWVNKGNLQPVSLEVLPLVRSNTNQTTCDSTVAANGLVCTVYTDSIPVSGTPTPFYKYVIANSVTGQNIVAPTVIPVAGGAVGAGGLRVFVLGNYFIIVFGAVISAVNSLRYLAISVQNPTVTATGSISTAYSPQTEVGFDGIVANSRLYLAWNSTSTTVKLASLSTALNPSNTVSFASQTANAMTVTADMTGSSPVIYASYYTSSSTSITTLAVDHLLNTVLAPTTVVSGVTIQNLVSTAQNAVCTLFYEVVNKYGYDSSIPTNYVSTNTVTQAGVVGTPKVVDRGVSLASKAFILNGSSYFLAAYTSPYQPTYFLLEGNGNVIAKMAYSNGAQAPFFGLTSVTLTGEIAQMAYLLADLVQAVNKTQGVVNTAGVYSQTGINLASFDIGSSVKISTEIGSDLHFTGGFLWMYDGYTPVEHGFHLWPDYVEATTTTGAGNITAQQYFYQATYEWSDNQGNVFRSAPSIPVSVTTTTSSSTNTIHVPTLRLTYKIANPVKIVLYRWSVAQQVYYQVTTINNPILNDPTVDYVTITDTSSDAAILGNNIIYTTGGVLENIEPNGIETMTLWQDRFVGLMSEDRNLLWYSKQVIETTPVDLNDGLTLYVAPTIGSQGSTGPIKTLSAMDDKLIVFKENAIYYFTGAGPDNTGGNSQIGDPVFVTATVGCSNQSSIVFMPSGLMFQSDKGIWLLGRDLASTYIGSPVQSFTQNATVLSAISVPGTNQIRFTLDSGFTLMYDYFYGQWGVFVNVPAISSTLYQDLHTYLNVNGTIFQETPGKYLDASNPVLMSFTTGWINPAGLQGFQRAYELYLLGVYITPHLLQVQIGYNYSSSPQQSTIITPDNFVGTWGSEQLWGSGGPWGGPGNIEKWRVFFDTQKCESFQITINELYDPSKGVPAGAGLTMSGMNLTVGLKDSRPRRTGANSIG